MTLNATKLLCLALIIPALACVGGDGQKGLCVEITRIQPVITVTVDGSDVIPTLAASCTVEESSFAGGVASLVLTCTDADALEHEVVMSAKASASPSGVVPGADVELALAADETFDLGSGSRVLLSDAEGPIFAQVLYSYGGATWGPITVSYDSYCAADGDNFETGSGFVLATISGERKDYDVFVGEPEVLDDAGLSWDIHATDATDVCCHGSTIDAAIVRH